MDDELWVPRQIMSKIVLRKSGSLRKVKGLLSKREFEILSLITTGATNKEIGERLNLSSHAIKSHIYKMYRKIHVRNRLQVIYWVEKNVWRL